MQDIRLTYPYTLKYQAEKWAKLQGVALNPFILQYAYSDSLS